MVSLLNKKIVLIQNFNKLYELNNWEKFLTRTRDVYNQKLRFKIHNKQLTKKLLKHK